MEEIIRNYFSCWLNKDEKPLTDIFADNIIYSECYGPEYGESGKSNSGFMTGTKKEL